MMQLLCDLLLLHCNVVLTNDIAFYINVANFQIHVGLSLCRKFLNIGEGGVNPYFCNTAYWAADWVELSVQAQHQHKKQSSKTVGPDLGYILHNLGNCDFFVYI